MKYGIILLFTLLQLIIPHHVSAHPEPLLLLAKSYHAAGNIESLIRSYEKDL